LELDWSSLDEIDIAFLGQLNAAVEAGPLATYAADERSGAAQAYPRWAVDESYRLTLRRVCDPSQFDLRLPPSIESAVGSLFGCQRAELLRLQFNAMLPGQSLGVHTDIPEFRGARRGQLPDWLLVTMIHSGLFDDRQERVVTAVIWPRITAGGALEIFGRQSLEKLASVEPEIGKGVLFDGSRLPHSVSTVPGHPPIIAPEFAIEARGRHWVSVGAGGAGKFIEAVAIRCSVVLSIRCEMDQALPTDKAGSLDESAVVEALANEAGLDLRDKDLEQQLVNSFVSYMR
jgi:hypothetical protein